MVFQASVEAEKWTRKDEAVYAVSLRLGCQGELNNGWMFEAMAFSYSRSIPRQVVESRVESVLWQEDGRVLVEKAYYYFAD